MPNKLRFCILCKRYDRTIRSNYTRIYTVEREAKLLEGYRRRNNGQELNRPMLNETVHQKCYNKIVQGVSSIEESISSTDALISSTQQPEDDEDQDKASLIQFRSRMPFPSNFNKRNFERRQRVCAICNSYGYRSHNKLKQIVSNFMANKLAEGYSHIYKRPIEKSLLDAYLHKSCFRKLYSSYRYHALKKSINRTCSQRQGQFVNLSLYSPHETRSRSSVIKRSSSSSVAEIRKLTPKTTTNAPINLSIEQLFSTPFYSSVATTNPKIELSARSCLFRPCIQRLTPDEIDFYTKRNSVMQKTEENNALTTDQLPFVRLPLTQISTEDDSISYLHEDNDISINEQDRSPNWMPKHLSPSRLTFNEQQKIRTAAKISRRYLKPPPLAKATNPLIYDHTYTNHTQLKVPIEFETLHDWLVEKLKSEGNPLSMGDVLKKYREITAEERNPKARESICRERLRHRLEKFYSNQFVFVTPNRREGTFIALNDINHYIRLAIKNAKVEKEKAAETSILSSIIIPPAPIDYERQTCETVMNGIRKIRLYIRDPKHVDSLPSNLLRNVISLITTSEKQFDKISQQYDFYRMIDDDLFDSGDNKIVSNRSDRNLRNMSLASDLISARHDNRVSQKHFLLADELSKKGFHCTPRQVITLLNRYGHTCSYKSYTRMKATQQRTTSELGEEIMNELEEIITNDDKSSDSELDLMEL